MLQSQKIDVFRKLHRAGNTFVLPNIWDAGAARMMEGLGFEALATTSSGFALTKGRRDYGVTREETMEHCREIAAAIDIPLTADLENGFGDAPEDAAETIRQAATTGLCGGSIEDASGNPEKPIYEFSHAVERIAAAAEAKNKTPDGFMLTARAEAFLYGDADLEDVIARLNAFADAGADVLFAPGLPDLETVRTVCSSVAKPVSVLILGKLEQNTVADLADAGATRLSTGGGLAKAAYGTLADATAMLTEGRFDCLGANRDGAKKVTAFLKG